MSKVFSRWSRVCVPALAAVILVTGISMGRASAQDIFMRKLQVIYEGAPVDQSNMKLGSWGSGLCEESSENALAGSRSLKITPKDLYTGGRIDFATPLDLTESAKNPDAYLQFVCQFFGAQAMDSLTQSLGTAAAATDMYGGTATPGKQVRKLRAVFFFENGPAVEVQGPLSAYKVGDDGWMVVSFPMAALKGKTELSQYRITRIVLTGDGTEPFFVGEIRIVPDSAPLVADTTDDMEVSKNYPIAFQGFCKSGGSAVKYSWDFDKKNGIQAEAVNDLVYHRFTNIGSYEVTLTITDMFGIKQPASKIIRVKVNE